MDVSRVVPQPTTIALGGRPWLAAEFRVNDLAELQSWANERAPSPFEAASFDLLHRPRDLQWKMLLASVLDDQERYHPDLDDQLWTEEGIQKQIFLSLRKYQPDFTPDNARDLHRDAMRFPATFDVDLGKLVRVAWGMDPLDTMRGMIDGPRGDGSEPTDWGSIYYDYISKCKNGPPFGDLTLTQLRLWLSRGEDRDENRADYAEVAKRRREFWGDLAQ